MQAARGAALTGPPAASNPPGPPGRRRLGLVLAVAAAVYVADVVSKIIVVATLPPRHLVDVVDGLLTLQLVRNSGAAFSLGTSMTVVFTLIAVGVIIFILRTSRQLRSLPWAVTLGLLLGGATGNLTDRLLRSPGLFRGDVVDWIQLPHWPVFNVADSAIVCGGLLAVFLAARGVRLDGTHDGRGGRGGHGRPGAGAHGRGHPGDSPSGQAGSPPARPGQPVQPREPGKPGEAGPPVQPGQAGQPGPAQERGSAAGDSRA
jgi:signal peptidase II